MKSWKRKPFLKANYRRRKRIIKPFKYFTEHPIQLYEGLGYPIKVTPGQCKVDILHMLSRHRPL